MSAMVQEMEVQKPRVTEIQVRMDCHGCVQKVKKALNGINGILDVNINYPEQKITILGLADPEKIVKAIRKARKTATICAHFDPEAASEQAAEGAPPEGGSGQPAPPTEPPNEQPCQLPDTPQQVTADEPQHLNQNHPAPEAVQSVPVIYHQPPDSYSSTHLYNSGCALELNHFQTGDRFQTEQPHQPQQYYIQQAPSHVSYMPSPKLYMNYQSPSPQVRATHNYNTRIPPSQTYTFQPPHQVQESQSYQLNRPSPQTYVLQPLQPPQHVQESHSYQLNRPSTQTYVIQPPQQPQHSQCNYISPSSPQTDPYQPHQLHYTSQLLQQGQTIYNHNRYIPSSCMTEYDYIQPPATHTRYNQMSRCSDDYSYPSSDGNISSMFSDENPNACNIM